MIARFTQHLYRLAAAAAMAFMLFAPSNAYAQSGPFSGLGGSWRGSGHVYLTNGTRERIRCRAKYTVSNDGNVLQQNLRCASDSYNFQFSSYVQNEDGELAGTWSEHTRGVGGRVTGHDGRGRITARIEGSTVTAELDLVFRRNRQHVTIRSGGGGGFKGATIVLARR